MIINFLIYTIVLILTPVVHILVGFISFFPFARILGFCKERKNETLLNIVFSIEATCSMFLTIILLNKLLNIFGLNINWVFAILFSVGFLINGIQRIRMFTNQDKVFEIYLTIGDALGMLIGFTILFFL